jgi:copper(I)-binding protein
VSLARRVALSLMLLFAATATTSWAHDGPHPPVLAMKPDLKPGEKVAVILEFERGAEVRVEAPVK